MALPIQSPEKHDLRKPCCTDRYLSDNMFVQSLELFDSLLKEISDIWPYGLADVWCRMTLAPLVSDQLVIEKKQQQKEIVTMIIKTKVLGGENVVVVVVGIGTRPLLRKLEAAGEADMEVLVVVRCRSRSIL